MPQRGVRSERAASFHRRRPDASPKRGMRLRPGPDDAEWQRQVSAAVTPSRAQEVPRVTEPTTRLLDTFSLPSFDFTPEEARLVKGAVAAGAIVLWLAAALIDAWFLLAVPVVAGLCALAIWRLRQARPASDDPDDGWSF